MTPTELSIQKDRERIIRELEALETHEPGAWGDGWHDALVKAIEIVRGEA